MAAVAAWMAAWWLTEAVPIAVTALLPLVLFPMAGILPSARTAANYGNHLVFVFFGGFALALAMERWGLHRRVALHVLCWLGGGPRRILLGFMLGKDGVEQAFGRKFADQFNIHRTRGGFQGDGIDTFPKMAEKGVFVVDRVVQERMGGGVDLEKDVWYIPDPGLNVAAAEGH